MRDEWVANRVCIGTPDTRDSKSVQEEDEGRSAGEGAECEGDTEFGLVGRAD